MTSQAEQTIANHDREYAQTLFLGGFRAGDVFICFCCLSEEHAFMVQGEVVCPVALGDADAMRRGFHNQAVYRTHFSRPRQGQSQWRGGRRSSRGRGRGRFPGGRRGRGPAGRYLWRRDERRGRGNPYREPSAVERGMLADAFASNPELVNNVRDRVKKKVDADQSSQKKPFLFVSIPVTGRIWEEAVYTVATIGGTRPIVVGHVGLTKGKPY